MAKTAIYPGSFDPITNGHLDIIKRASRLFDKLIISVAYNSSKQNLFTADERVRFIEESIQDMSNITVTKFDGLLVDVVEKYGVCTVIRGMRSISDYEYESQMAIMNRELNKQCETIFLMPSPKYSFVSSRMIREIAFYKGDISLFIPLNLVEIVIARATKSSKLI